MPLPPVYDDGRLAVIERYTANGSDLVVRMPASAAAEGHAIDPRAAEELRDGLSEWLTRHGR